MTKSYIIKRQVNGGSTFIGAFNEYTSMFDTGSSPYEFTAINIAIRVAETLNLFISKDSEPYRVYELSATKEDSGKISKPEKNVKEVLEEEHDIDIESEE